MALRTGIVLVGTSDQRASLKPGQKSPGMEFRETDTNLRYTLTASGAWMLIAAGPAAHAGDQGSTTSPPSPVSVPESATALPYGLTMKSGYVVAATSVAFGNEYFPVVTFPEAFPNACLHVSTTPLSGDPITKATGAIALDTLSASEFRAMIPESAHPWVRGFTWVAFGH